LETTQKNILYYAGLLIGAWLLGLAGESIYAPAMPSIASSLGTSDALIKLTVTFFIFGKTISMLICSPIAEVFARRQFLLFGLLLFILGGLICTFSPDIHILLTGRLIQGLGVSITILMGRAIVNDRFENRYAAQVFSYIFTGNAIGIFILPVLGGYLATFLSWRWIFFILTCYGAVVFILLLW
jgi:predicted MFS family arabinose efflux permease